MMISHGGSTTPKIIQWFIDTRTLWPVPKGATSRDEVQELANIAKKELSLLTPDEQKSVLRYYHLRDAKTKLASHLLKHFVITHFCSIPWSQVTLSRGAKGKPFYLSPLPLSSRLDFNVSHQAGIVSIIAAVGFITPIDVGTDIVCVNERQILDYRFIDKEGFFKWVDIHSDVFADSELSEVKLAPVPVNIRVKNARVSGYGMDAISRCQRRDQVITVKAVSKDGGDFEVKVDGRKVVDGKLRRFYAFWCAREAYVKMTGEAFAAPWLKELEISGVRAPDPPLILDDEGGGDLMAGEIVRDFKMTFKGKPVTDVKMELAALGNQYMIAGAVRVPKALQGESLRGEVVMGKWEELDLKDILELAERS